MTADEWFEWLKLLADADAALREAAAFLDGVDGCLASTEHCFVAMRSLLDAIREGEAKYAAAMGDRGLQRAWRRAEEAGLIKP